MGGGQRHKGLRGGGRVSNHIAKAAWKAKYKSLSGGGTFQLNFEGGQTSKKNSKRIDLWRVEGKTRRTPLREGRRGTGSGS